jgi:hypothetical protein
LDEETTKSKAEKTLAFLVESGAIYICILVHPDQLLLLCEWTDYRSLVGGLYHDSGIRHSLGNCSRQKFNPTRGKIIFCLAFVGLGTDPCYQGIYPTAIVVVITMRLSATDILSRPGGVSRPYSTPIVFIPRSPTLQISEAGLNDSDTENGRKMTSRQDL